MLLRKTAIPILDLVTTRDFAVLAELANATEDKGRREEEEDKEMIEKFH